MFNRLMNLTTDHWAVKCFLVLLAVYMVVANAIWIYLKLK
jgi:hypothetical protein